MWPNIHLSISHHPKKLDVSTKIRGSTSVIQITQINSSKGNATTLKSLEAWPKTSRHNKYI